MFSQGEKVVYPGHGVARIARILEKRVAGKIDRFFELKFLNTDMTILVPVENTASVGMRPLCSKEHIVKVLQKLSEPKIDANPDNGGAINWNKRNKDYQGKIRTGNLDDIGEIYRDLFGGDRSKELSFGEKLLLQQTETFLIEEIALVENISEEVAKERVRSLVCGRRVI